MSDQPTVATDPGLVATAAGVSTGDLAILAAGTRIGRYVVRDVLGLGGMGVVYRADDPELGRDVAVKVLRPTFARDPSARQRFVREAKAMARVAHPNVAAVYEVGEFDGQVFVAMERVNGGSLRAWLRVPRTVGEIVDVFVAAGTGLLAAHDAGLVHRDFKPDNVLVGDDERVRVADFGLAYDLVIDRDDEIVGTPAYMAPEQHAAGVIDIRTDQFAFCATLYEALFDQPAFARTSRPELASAIVAGDIAKPPSGHRVPRSLQQIVWRGMATRPSDRFATMRDLLHALRRDRARRPRRIAVVALVALGFVGAALASDGVLRDRARAVTVQSFAAARAQLARQVEARTDTFVALSDLSYILPVMNEASGPDQADFGLDTETSDRARLENVHASLASADWSTFQQAGRAGPFAIADAKGRLLYASAAPARRGTSIRGVPVLDAAYSESRSSLIEIVRADDPSIAASGLLGDTAQPGLYVLLARTKFVGEQPRALFVQLVPVTRWLARIDLGPGVHLSLVSPRGDREGTVPIAIGSGSGDDVRDVQLDAMTWLVEDYVLAGTRAPIATFVIARPLDVGLAGLFPWARRVLIGAALLLLVATIGGFALARRSRPGRRRNAARGRLQ